MSEPVLSVRDLHVEFPTRRGILRAIDGISFDIVEGEVPAAQSPRPPVAPIHIANLVDGNADAGCLQGVDVAARDGAVDQPCLACRHEPRRIALDDQNISTRRAGLQSEREGNAAARTGAARGDAVVLTPR